MHISTQQVGVVMHRPSQRLWGRAGWLKGRRAPPAEVSPRGVRGLQGLQLSYPQGSHPSPHLPPLYPNDRALRPCHPHTTSPPLAPLSFPGACQRGVCFTTGVTMAQGPVFHLKCPGPALPQPEPMARGLGHCLASEKHHYFNSIYCE